MASDAPDDVILLVLRAARGVQSRAATALGMSYTGFLARIGRHPLRGHVADLMRDMAVLGEIETREERSRTNRTDEPGGCEIVQARQYRVDKNPSAPLARIGRLVEMAVQGKLHETYDSICVEAMMGLLLTHTGGSVNTALDIIRRACSDSEYERDRPSSV